jgi:hypothetical protein
VLGKFFFKKIELWQFPHVKGVHSFFAVRYFLMRKLIALAAGMRRNAVLCCGAAILLSACGAGLSDPVSGLPSRTAAELASNAVQPAANNTPVTPYGAEAAPTVAEAAAPTMPVATPVAPAPRPRAAGVVANIEPAYDSKSQPARTAGFSDQAESPAEVAQETETAAAACDTAGCQH